jgi:hypothetical protein
MPNRINANQIKTEFDSVIAHADTIEPQLAERLRQFSRWIKNTKPGSLTKKRDVLNLLIEIMQDAKIWLELKDFNSEEKLEYHRKAESTPPEIYWYETLFPMWFSNLDSKLTIWTKKLMAGEFANSDKSEISSFADKFDELGVLIFYRYILDLSMATDFLVSGSSKRSLAVQLTRTNPKMLDEKQKNWKETLIYWDIKRGVLFSQSPNHPIRRSTRILFELSDSLADDCYVVCISVDN